MDREGAIVVAAIHRDTSRDKARGVSSVGNAEEAQRAAR